MILKSERLILKLLDKPCLQEHQLELTQLDADPVVRYFYPSGPMTSQESLNQLNFFIRCYQQDHVPYFVVLDTSDQFLGRCGFFNINNGDIALSYAFYQSYWGQGLATEALKTILKWGQENLYTSYVVGFAVSGNIASHKVMEKAGMHYEYARIDTTDNIELKYYRYDFIPDPGALC